MELSVVCPIVVCQKLIIIDPYGTLLGNLHHWFCSSIHISSWCPLVWGDQSLLNW